MRSLTVLLFSALPFALPHALCASESSGRTPAGTYDILICEGACSFDTQANVLVKGRVVLFADKLEQPDLQRFDESHLNHHFGEAINGCFTLERLGKSRIYAGGEKVGLTEWTADGGQFHFSLFHSPDAGYRVSVRVTQQGLVGSGSSWGAGAADPDPPTRETVIARRTGGAAIANCTFETPEEHEQRRMLADPVRGEVFAIENAYRAKLIADLEISPTPRDWAMAGWLQKSEEGDAQILRARETAPNDALVRWIAVLRTRAREVPVAEDGVAGVTFQYSELDGAARAELERSEPHNAAVWLIALRTAVDAQDAGATDAALARLASCTSHDDHAAELLAAQLKLFRTHPPPAELFAAVARLDPAWKLNGDFTPDVAPYYQNQYPFAAIGISNLFYMPAEAGMHELFVACVQQRVRSAERTRDCVTTARLLAARSRRADARQTGSRLLSEIDDFTSDDVALARSQDWLVSTYQQLHPRLGTGHRPFVHDEIAFVDDWMQIGDENEAVRRAVERAGKPLQAPTDFRLNRALYGNFEKAQANERASPH